MTHHRCFAFDLPAMVPVRERGGVFETGTKKEVSRATKRYGEALNRRLELAGCGSFAARLGPPTRNRSEIAENKNAAERNEPELIPDRDIGRAANLLIREHGAGAESCQPGEPMKCSNAAIATGNLSGFALGE